MALAMTLALLLLIYIMGFAFLTVASQDYYFTKKAETRIQAYYLAESGIEYSLAKRMDWIEYPHIEEIQTGEHTCTIVATDTSASVIELGVTGKALNSSKSILIRFSSDGGVIYWAEPDQLEIPQ
ncbi:MAG: hypothetical protein ACLFQV_08990 [Vulcanimicrobiota bacterium]